MGGVNAAGELISKAVKKNAAIFFGMSIDRSLDDNVKLTLIATGLKDKDFFKSLRSVTGLLRSVVPGF